MVGTKKRGTTLIRCEHGCLESHCLYIIPEGSIKYVKEGHMGGELTQPWIWQQDTMVQMD